MRYIIELEIEDWDSKELHDLISQSLPDLDSLKVQDIYEFGRDISNGVKSYQQIKDSL